LDFDALGVLDLRLADRDRDAFGVFDLRLERRRLGVLDFFGAASPSAAFGALGVLALRLEDRRFEALGVFERRLADRERDDLGVFDLRLVRRLGVLDFFGASSPSTAFLGALGVLALRLDERRLEAFGVLDLRFADREREALGVLDLRFERRRLGVFDFLGASPSSTVFLGALGVLALRLDERRFEALGVRDLRLEERDLEALGVFDLRLDRRRLGVLDFDFITASSPSAAFLGALGVLALRRDADLDLLFEALGVLERRLADRDLEALGVLDLRFDRRRLGVLDFDFITASSPSTAFLGALGVLALRRDPERDRRLDALGVLDFLFERLRLGVLDFDFITASSPSTAFLGALGVLALRRDADRDRLLEAFGVLDFLLADLDRLFEALGVLDFLFERLRLGVLDFDFITTSSPSTAFLGAFGVLALRRDADRDLLLEALGVLDFLLADLERLFEALGVLDFRFERLRLGVLDLDFITTSSEASGLGALGVLAFREEDRFADLLLDFEALGVLDLRLDARRVGVFFLADRRTAFGALGVRALLLEVDRVVLLLDALGARLLRLEALRRRDRFFGSLGDLALLRRRETDLLLLLLDLGVLLRRADRFFCFFLDGDLGALLALVGVRARFLIPMSLLRFSSISALYFSRASTWVW